MPQKNSPRIHNQEYQFRNHNQDKQFKIQECITRQPQFNYSRMHGLQQQWKYKKKNSRLDSHVEQFQESKVQTNKKERKK